MKKIWPLFIPLFILGILRLTWCFDKKNPEVIDDCIIPEDCTVDEPVVDEPEISLIDQLKQSFTWNLINWKVDESLLTNKPNNIYFDITWDSTLYYIDEFWLAFTLWEEWKWWKIENAYEWKYLASVRIRNEWLKTYWIFIIDNTTYQRIKDSLSNDEDETIWYNNQYTFQRRIVDNWDKLWEYNLVLYEVDVEESEVNLEAIDTEEKRKEWCKDEAMNLFNEMIPNWEFVNLVWEGLEKETIDDKWNLTIIQRNFRIVYNQDWYEWFWPWLCETNFVEWKQNVIFSQSYMNI